MAPGSQTSMSDKMPPAGTREILRDLDRILDRLDAGIEAERSAMNALLDRVSKPSA